MDGSDHVLLQGLLSIALISAGPVLLFWSVLHARDIAAWAISIGRALRLLPHPPPVPQGPPIERVAADLRRLSGALGEPAGMSLVRRRGLQLAYDDALVTACRQLEINHELDQTPDDVARRIERLRVEACLEAAGLWIRSSRSRDDR